MTRRYLSRTDTIQEQVVAALRQAGVLVQHTHSVAGGFPDLVCLVQGRVVLVELKSRHGTHTPAEVIFQAKWPVVTLRSVDEAIAFVNTLAGEPPK